VHSPALVPWLLLAPLALVPATGAGAGSDVVLPPPSRYGEIPAHTYDQETGERLGDAWIRMARGEDGRVILEGRTGIRGGASTQVRAEMRPTADGRGLRLLRQESRSADPLGHAMGVLVIDHEAGFGSCTGPADNGVQPEPRRVDLPDDDRVVNIPLTLLFQPLVRGERDELKFQILICRGGPRIVSAVARVEEDGIPPARAGGAELVRIRYELSLPRLLARIAARWLPSLSFWFDPAESGAWIGHEMPLYAKGPTVLVVREDYTPALLGGAP